MLSLLPMNKNNDSFLFFLHFKIFWGYSKIVLYSLSLLLKISPRYCFVFFQIHGLLFFFFICMCCICISEYKKTTYSFHICYLFVCLQNWLWYCTWNESSLTWQRLFILFSLFLWQVILCLELRSHVIFPFQVTMSSGALLVQVMFNQHCGVDFVGVASLKSLEDTI